MEKDELLSPVGVLVCRCSRLVKLLALLEGGELSLASVGGFLQGHGRRGKEGG